jgi:UDP-3-O-[3-hydroxymyristoyl] glucosamine N-acyltransferase
MEWPSPSERTLIRAPEPRTAFARAMSRFYPTVEIKPGVDPTAVVAKGVELGALVFVGPHAVVGEGTRVGVASSIGSGCYVGKRVVLGEGCVLHPNVTVYDNVDIGRGSILHSGCVIGADGFGYVMEDGRWHKFPQVGRVEIGDFVEIGANSCVDRAAMGVTSIGEGTKLDNMVHVAHNCRIGRHVVVAAQTGFSGGVTVGDYAVIGGQVGIGDKARIESRAVLGSGCGVLTSKIVHSGETVWGTPARPLKQHLEQLANLARLPELRREIADIKRRLAELEG